MIEVIRVPNDKVLKTTDGEGVISGLGRLNIFIGENNSGKSRFIRHLFNSKSVDKGNAIFYGNRGTPNHWTTLSNLIRSQLRSAILLASRHHAELNIEQRITSLVNATNDTTKSIEQVARLLHILENITEEDFVVNIPDSYRGAVRKRVQSEVVKGFNQIPSALQSVLENFTIKEVQQNRIYIPVLRGLRPINMVSNSQFTETDVYKTRTSVDYGWDVDKTKGIFTGLTMYRDVLKLLTGDEEARETIRQFERFLEEYVFEEKITLIPKYDHDVLHIKIGKEKQFEIFRLGDGLQTITTILFPLFMTRNTRQYAFIEEPECHLHPRWERKLLSALLSDELTNHQYFISTHSSSIMNHPEAVAYRITRDELSSLILPVRQKGSKHEVLESLGYRPSDVLQANYILWVEGHSDRLYFKYLIESFAPELIHGEDYSILVFGGSGFSNYFNGESLQDLLDFNPNMGVILDSDKTNASSRLKKNKLEIESNFNSANRFCWITAKREIENYIPYSVYVDALRSMVNDDQEVSAVKGDYVDRGKYSVKNELAHYSPNIRIPADVWSKVQSNGDGSTKGIDGKLLRRRINEAIQSTAKSSRSVPKMKLARAVVAMSPIFDDAELVENMTVLIDHIKSVAR